jgi:hypothetical protein
MSTPLLIARSTGPELQRTDCEFTKCDSCGLHFDADGNVTHEQPHCADVNSEAGTCPQCVNELARLGVPIVPRIEFLKAAA